ncbi:RsmE family RNA methyltransferase [Bacillus piscicola]|uniref:RsmE family RNA methyltransferase n=1 Tax=Bacillus piscicola TaxID=1632684 RepID=UPI001F095BEA|nr:RsmE family RNA methyltransferase [Bacillus piscicola]
MQRYFVKPEQMTDSTVTLAGDDVKHAAKVMRMKTGDKIVCLNNKGRQALCRIDEIGSSFIHAAIVKEWDDNPELPVRTVIGQALVKGDKMDFVIQKGTEFGVSAFHLFEADRSVVKWGREKSLKKIERLRKIAKEAAEQSERLFIPEIHWFASVEELIQGSAMETTIVLHEEKARSKQHGDLASLLQAEPSALLAVIGPEGGISEREIDFLARENVMPVSLGPRILRSESASVYLLAVLSYYYELSR